MSFTVGAGTRYVVTSTTNPSGGSTVSGPFTITGGTATTNTPVLDATQTWNAGAVTFTGWRLNVTDTASNASSLLMDLQVGGTSQFSVNKTGTITAPGNVSLNFGVNASFGYDNVNGKTYVRANQDNVLSLQTASTITFGNRQAAGNTLYGQISSTGLYIGSVLDTILTRDAANTFAQRNGVNPQAFNIYNTYTDASNYERGFMRWSANTLQLGTENFGTGSTRVLAFSTNGTNRWQIDTLGTLLPSANNTYTIGNIVNNPSVIYASQSVYITDADGSDFGRINYGRIRFSADGVFLFRSWGATDFGRLQFGGATASFPALKRNATFLETKLADDSAYAPHAMQYLDITDGITAPASASGRARIYVDTADGDLKIVFGDGTVKTIVVDT